MLSNKAIKKHALELMIKKLNEINSTGLNYSEEINGQILGVVSLKIDKLKDELTKVKQHTNSIA